MTGYLHPDYAHALAEFGEPVCLKQSGGWLLRRAVAGTDQNDAMGGYPIFSCPDWSGLAADLAGLAPELVSVALVADSFGQHTEAQLRAAFDRVIPFKAHFVAELDRPVAAIASKHHRYYARKSLGQVTVETVSDLAGFLDDWCALYANLVQRHEVTGIKAFSRESFRRQLAVPGLTALRAVHEGRTVGAHLWFTQGEVAHSHLAAFDPVGYEHMAAYALYWRAIEHFSGRVRWLNFGAGAGLTTDATDGLTRFKSGWATGHRTAWFCGRILQPDRYEALTATRGGSATTFFPGYRAQEIPPPPLPLGESRRDAVAEATDGTTKSSSPAPSPVFALAPAMAGTGPGTRPDGRRTATVLATPTAAGSGLALRPSSTAHSPFTQFAMTTTHFAPRTGRPATPKFPEARIQPLPAQPLTPPPAPPLPAGPPGSKSRPGDFALFGGTPVFTEKLHVGRPNIGDRAGLMARMDAMLNRRWLSNNGPFVQEFEQAIASYTGTRNCICVCNATVGLEIAVRAAGLEGEAIVPAYTFVATAHALQWQRLTPVFADMDPATHNLDPARIERHITPNTTAIVATHIWGRPCAVDALTDLARRRGLKLIFDAAHAFGCSDRGRMVGGFGDAEVFSFHATKFINSFEGGAITTNDDELAHRIRLMTNFGFAGFDNVVHVGTNGKMSEACAAMGLTSLAAVDDFIAVNHRNYDAYRSHLADLPGLRIIDHDARERRNLQYVVVEVEASEAGLGRDELVRLLHAENIIARKYFWPGVHRMEPYRTLFPNAHELLPETERVAPRVIVLPTGTAVEPADIARICGVFRSALEHAPDLRRRLAQLPAA